MKTYFVYGVNSDDLENCNLLNSIVTSAKLNLPSLELMPLSIEHALDGKAVDIVNDKISESDSGGNKSRLVCLDWTALLASAGVADKYIWLINDPFVDLENAIQKNHLCRNDLEFSENMLLLGLWMSIANSSQIATPNYKTRSSLRKRFTRWVDLIPLPPLMPIALGSNSKFGFSIILASTSLEICRNYVEEISELAHWCKNFGEKMYIFAGDEINKYLRSTPETAHLIDEVIIIEDSSVRSVKSLQPTVHIHIGPFDRLGIFRPEDSWQNGKLVIQYDKITKARSIPHLRNGSNGYFHYNFEELFRLLVECRSKTEIVRGLSASGHRAYIEAAHTWPDVLEKVAK